jgi:hypothetical protein
MVHRTCAFCQEPIPDGKRWDARFCSDLCRGRNHRGISPDTATDGNGGERAGSRRPARRRSRNGQGVRLYIVPADTNATIIAKVTAARERRKP